MSRIDTLESLDIPVKPHLEQLSRIRRWKERLDEIRFSNSPESSIPDHYDFIYAFFINCYHLRDFLKYGEIVPMKVVDKLFEENVEMQICRDICNESKHCIIDRPSIGGRIPNTNRNSANGWAGVCLVKEYDPFQEILKNDNHIKNIKCVVLAKGIKYDVFELADKCLKLWENLFEEINLI